MHAFPLQHKKVKSNFLLRSTKTLCGVLVMIVLLNIVPFLETQIAYSLQGRPNTRKFPMVVSDECEKARQYNDAICIPKIHVIAPLLETKIENATPKNIFSQLEQGVGMAQDGAKPGNVGNVFVFGHSSDSLLHHGSYKTVFLLLDKLKQGDMIFVFWKGMKYEYAITTTKIVSSHDLSVLEQNEETRVITLMTCWPPLTTWKRYIVIGSLVQSRPKNVSRTP